MRKVLALITIASVFFSDTECVSLSGAAQQNKPAMIDQMAVMADWLATLHSQLVQQPNVATSRALAFGTEVQLAKQGRDIAWRRKSADSETSWTKVTPSYATINTASAGVLVTAFGGHVSRPKGPSRRDFSSTTPRYLTTVGEHSTLTGEAWDIVDLSPLFKCTTYPETDHWLKSTCRPNRHLCPSAEEVSWRLFFLHQLL